MGTLTGGFCTSGFGVSTDLTGMIKVGTLPGISVGFWFPGAAHTQS